jgi:hypothetical protein
MATITSAQTGNFSDVATWVGGVVPTVGDIAVAATGHVVAIDVDTTVDAVDQAGTGKFTLGNGRTLTAAVTIRAGTFTSGGTVEVTATSGNTATIIGNISGVSSTANNVAGVVVTGTGKLVVQGAVTGTAGNNSSEANRSAGVYTDVACEIEITGTVEGGGGNHKHGVNAGTNSTTAAITVSGSVFGGSGSGGAGPCAGVFLQGADASLDVAGNVRGGSNSNASDGVRATGTSCAITVVGNVSILASPSANGNRGISATGASAVVTVTGNVTAGPLISNHGILVDGTSAIVTITGDVTGGSGTTAYGAHATGASATCTVTGDVTAGGGSGAFGVYNSGASSFIDVTGTITAASSNHGVRSDATSVGVRLAGNLTNQQNGTVACWARIFRIVSTSPSGITQIANDTSFPTGGLISFVSPDNVTGMPSISNVRANLTYGFNNELLGELAVPPSASVTLGVAVDDGIGTAALSVADIWNYLAENATTPNSLGAILANITSLLREDAIEQIITYNRNINETLELNGRTFNINTLLEAYPIVSFGEEI